MSHQPLYTSFFFELCLLLVILLPLISCLASWCVADRYSWLVSFLSPFLLLLSTLSAAYVFFSVWNNPAFLFRVEWFEVAGFIFSAGVYINNVSVLMMLVVTLISFLVHVYSIGYMAGDAAIRKYFSMLGFFTFSMLGIVMADNLLLIFIFWELVGFSSYMLVGHWQHKLKAAAAAKKAFIINRIGDAGFLIGLMIIWSATGTMDLLRLSQIDFNEILSWQTAAALCLFCGAIGKSAQFPLLTWLPDAMEGPTPVSALIHAATMVAAGVYLLVRIEFLFTPLSLHIVTVIGIITALMGALAALVQTDIKKILAFSTISQLGFMITAFGAGASEAAMLHLFTHAFFKACLFLSAGSIIHVLHHAQQPLHTHFDVQDIRNLGGLRKKLPFTFMAFVLSGGALASLPFFTGFLSKDAILTSLMIWKGDEITWRWIVVALAFAVTFITVLYTFRLVWRVFMGTEKSTASLTLPPVPIVMRAPVALLAIASCWVLLSWNPIDYQGWLYNGLHAGKIFHVGWMPFVSALWVMLALTVAYIFFRKENAFSSTLLLNNFYLDQIYQHIIIKPSLQAARLTNTFDHKWIDRFIHTTAYVQVGIAYLTGWVDRALVDGSVNATARIARGVGNFTRSFQGGKIQLYILWAILPIIIFLIWTLS